MSCRLDVNSTQVIIVDQNKRRRIKKNSPLTELPHDLLSLTLTFLPIIDMVHANLTMHRWHQIFVDMPPYIRSTCIDDVDKMFSFPGDNATTKALFITVFPDDFAMKNYDSALNRISAIGLACLIERVPLDRNNLTLLQAPLNQAEAKLQNIQLAIAAANWKEIEDACDPWIKQKDYIIALLIALEVTSPAPRKALLTIIFNTALTEYRNSQSNEDKQLLIELFNKFPSSDLCRPVKEKIIADLIGEAEYSLTEELIEFLPKERQIEPRYDLCMCLLWLERAAEARRIAEKITGPLGEEARTQVEELEIRERADVEIASQIHALINVAHCDDTVEAEAMHLYEGLTGRAIKETMLTRIRIAVASSGEIEEDEGDESEGIDEGDDIGEAYESEYVDEGDE